MQQPILKRPGNDFKGDVYDMEKGKDYLWIGSSGSGITGLPINAATGMLDGTSPIHFSHNPQNVNSISSDFYTWHARRKRKTYG
jgi:hypothetical protein